MAAPVDDLGHATSICRPARRIVSLVPSLTESIASVNPAAIVGATTFCTQPAGLDVPRIRGTKNPDIASIVQLAPDLVLANKEENRLVDVQRLRAAGMSVWVTDIRTVDGALHSLRRLFTDALGWDVPIWLNDARTAWSAPAPRHRLRAAIPIWRDPWMVVGSDTFTGDLAARLGLDNCFGDSPDRYPHTTIDDIRARRPEVVVLPDEPYAFNPYDGPEAFPDTAVALVEGRLLTWYGPSLVAARVQLLGTIMNRP